ncbi:MAG: GH3 auxin-responsive promoter family protein [Paludibacteraceae bacterium]|nr:GH3 auxin-responsive promoter family protein [Paludibacteraceae bacterium]
MAKSFNSVLAKFLLSVAGSINKKKLVKASIDCKKSQAETLRAILDYAKDSVYGKEHNFAKILEATSDDALFEAYRQNVKPNDYEDFRPYVERHKNGEENVLFPGKPKMYATTSGTTSEPKWIPITNEYYSNIYSKMTKVWLYSFIENRPEVFNGKIVSIVGKAIEGTAPDGTLYGSVSGVTQRDCPGFVKKLYTAPADVFTIADYKARYYCIMRFGIEQDVTLIVTANPSTIVEMQNNVNEFFDDYVDDIEKGTISSKINISDELRQKMLAEKNIKPNPKRAAELRALKAKYGTVLPKHYWPNLQILNTWKCGNTRMYLDKFKDSFPDCCLHQEFSYFSSECRAGLVMPETKDTNGTVVFPHMHYFEFVEEHDIDSENPKFLQLHELEFGKKYCPYVTTWAGLYRYTMSDLLEVDGKFNSIPTIHMIQKINGIVTMTGEKLHERQFISAVEDASKATGKKLKFYIGFADIEISAYHFYYEFEDQNITQAEADEFNKLVDENLKKVNIEYEAKRASFRVKDPIAHILVENSFEKFKARCIDEGARDGQFKLNILLQDENRHAKFKDLVKK